MDKSNMKELNDMTDRLKGMSRRAAASEADAAMTPAAPLSLIDIMALIDKVDASGLEEFSLTQGGQTLKLKKAASGAEAAAAEPTELAVPVADDAVAAAAEAKAAEPGIEEVASPVLGTFYRASEPGAAPYVDVGSHVESGDVIGLVEVMKLFSEVKAPVSGEVVEIMADDRSTVEYGLPLIRIRCA